MIMMDGKVSHGIVVFTGALCATLLQTDGASHATVLTSLEFEAPLQD